MPMATVKEGTFHTTHRSVNQIEKEKQQGQTYHEVQFGGVSPRNLRTHVILPHFDQIQKHNYVEQINS